MMNKQVRLTTAWALVAAVLSIPTLVYGQSVFQPTVELGDQASLVAKGAGAIVSIEVTCATPTNGTFVSVNLIQRTGNQTTRGNGFAQSFNCDSTPQTLEVLVTADSRPFKKGPAVAQAFLSACTPDFQFCESAQDVEEIRIKREIRIK